MVSDVRGKIRGYPIVTDDHPVFIVSEGCGSEPLGALFFVHIAFFLELIHHLVDLVGVVERLFAEPDIELTIEGFQVFLQGSQFFFLGNGLELLQALFFRHMDELVAVFVPNPSGRHLDIFPVVPVFREFAGDVEQFQVPGIHRQSQVVHLVAGIVDVILPGHIIPGGLHQIGKGTAHSRSPSMAHMERTGGIGTDVLDLDLFAFFRRQIPIALPFVHNGLQSGSQPVFLQVEVQKSGTGDFHFLHLGAIQEFLDSSGDHPGCTMEIPGRLQRKIGGEIAKRFLGRYGQYHRCQLTLGQFTCLNGFPDGSCDSFRQYILHVH